MSTSAESVVSFAAQKGFVWLSSVQDGLRLYMPRKQGDEWGYTGRVRDGQHHRTRLFAPEFQTRPNRVRGLLFKRVKNEFEGKVKGIATFYQETDSEYRLTVPKSFGMCKRFKKTKCPAELLPNGNLFVEVPTYFELTPPSYLKRPEPENRTERRRRKELPTPKTLTTNPYRHSPIAGAVYDILTVESPSSQEEESRLAIAIAEELYRRELVVVE